MIRTTKLLEYLELLRDRDIPARQLLAGTGISLKALSSSDYVIDIEQLDAVVMNLIRITGQSDIAFAVGERFDPSNMGIVGYALLSSRTLRDAMRLWHQYSNPLLGSPLRLAVHEKRGTHWEMVVNPMSPRVELQRFFIEEFLVSGVKLFRLLATQPPSFISLAFAYPRPPHHARYRETFNCLVEFDAPETLFRFRSPGLDTPIRSNDEEINRVVSHYCRDILQQLPRAGTVEPRLRSMFLVNSSQLPRRDEASKQLGISHSTLNRRLKRNGRTYRQIKQDFRIDLAKQYLDSDHMTQKQISHALGFTSPSAFCRAFKHWTGQTPGEYRSRHGARSGN